MRPSRRRCSRSSARCDRSDFLPPPQQRVVAISVVLRTRDGLKIFSLGDEQSQERELVQRFFDGLERYTPVLVSWNGSGFDLPVLNYRALRHGVDAHHYWEVGESDRDFRYNNYLSRYHWRHIDLMDVLSGYGASGRASLDLAAQLIGLPGKLGIGGAQVWPAYRRGELAAIRDYCETDVLNTYLIYLRFQLVRGELDAADLPRASSPSSRRSSRSPTGRTCSSISRSGRRRGMRADGPAVDRHDRRPHA